MKSFARINLSSVLTSVLSSVALAKGEALAKGDALRRLILVSSLALAAAGCDKAEKSAESIGIIGGEDGPTATWMTTRLPWSKDCPQEK